MNGNGEGLRVVRETEMQPFVAFSASLEYEGMVSTFDGFYAMEFDTDFGIVHIPVGKLEIDLTDEGAVRQALLRDDLTEGIKEDILEFRQSVLDGMVDELTIAIFCEALLPPSAITPFGTTYFTYNGHRMRNVRTHINGGNSAWQRIQTGVSTRNAAQDVATASIIVAGNVSATVGFLGSAISLWQHAVNVFGNQAHTIVPHSGDFLQVRIIFDEIRQRTYREFGSTGWVWGLTTQQITMRNIGSEQHYANNGNGINITSFRDINNI
ncbi:MAG: hypothetical protein FWE34_06340 [Defluviitaleaceae bacterium]|nr:hypothetical protein [Defluviitaleaceae bacterium]